MKLFLCAFICIFCITGCQFRIPEDALLYTPQTLQERQIQTRRFATQDRTQILSAATGVLQDLGFSIDEADAKLGVLVGSKTRDATSVSQVVSSLLIAVLAGQSMPIDSHQQIRVSIVMSPVKSKIHSSSKIETAVRVTFQRIITNTQNQISRAEQIKDVQMYREFFERLSKSAFLEANEI